LAGIWPMTRTLHSLVLATLVSFVTLWTTSITASILLVDWTGTVRGTPFSGIVDIGDTLIGSYSYDSPIAAVVSNPFTATYLTGHECCMW